MIRFLTLQLEENMENVIWHKLMKGNIILNSGMVPHSFDCQPDRKRPNSVPDRSLTVKGQRRQLFSEVIAEADRKQQNTPNNNSWDELCASTSYQIPVMGESHLQYNTEGLLVSTVVKNQQKHEMK